jgi:hypothetical protein
MQNKNMEVSRIFPFVWFLYERMHAVAVDKLLVQTASDTARVACSCQTDSLHWRNCNFVSSKISTVEAYIDPKRI